MIYWINILNYFIPWNFQVPDFFLHSRAARICLATEYQDLLKYPKQIPLPMWWNGRRGRLKIYSRRLGAGSSPVIGKQKRGPPRPLFFNK